MNGTISEGVQIMFIGMAVVALFLIILVFVMMTTSKVIALIEVAMPSKSQMLTNEILAGVSTNDNTKIAIAIAAALASKKD